MTNTAIDLCHRQQEDFKLLVHLGLFGFSMTCSLYNLGVWLEKREARNAFSTSLYTALAIYEVAQMNLHWKSR